MKTATHNVWTPTDSGVLIPNGAIVEGEEKSRTNIHHVKGRAIEIEAVFARHAIAIPPAGDVQRMLNKVKAMSDARLLNQMDRFNGIDWFDALHVERLADAILPLDRFAGAPAYLRRLLSGSLDFFERDPSAAKDAFWELELWALLRRRNAAVDLVDPPDIVLNPERGDLGIACKKLYSEKHVQNVLSKAVKQVSVGFDVAVVAINIDDLLPAQQLFKAATAVEVTARIRAVVDEFIAEHERHFKKYLSTQRLVGAMVTCNLVVDVAEWGIFHNYRQSTIWCFPGLDAEALARVRELERLVMGGDLPAT